MTWMDRTLLEHVWSAAGGDAALTQDVQLAGPRVLSSRYPVNDLAAAVVGAAGLGIAEFAAAGGGGVPVVVDRGMAGAWFGSTFRAQGWERVPLWDPIAGDYRCADGWIRLHTNDVRHRGAAVTVLGVADAVTRPVARVVVAAAVLGWAGEMLESAIVAAGGCAAQLRTPEQWRNHPQGMAVAHEPILAGVFTDITGVSTDPGPADRPLAGLKVLDLTRVLAGPASTRFLAGFGAQVLRIDPLDREEAALETEMTIGKHCARMDLRRHRAEVLDLLSDADVLIHGYRPGAMDGLGLGEPDLHAARPGLVEVTLDAYGWTGPWHGRRGFDSLVQMSSGIAFPAPGSAEATDGSAPTPLPVQALDHATGYLAATAALRGLSERRRTGLGSVRRVSLARTATLLQDSKSGREEGPVEEIDWRRATVEQTLWGPGLRLPGPVTVGTATMSYSVPAAPLGSAVARWA